MKRDDLRAAIKIERAYKGNKNTFTDIAHRPVTDDELVEAITADPDLRAKVLESLLDHTAGWWAQWCVLHLSVGADNPRCTISADMWDGLGDHTPCVWHPLGAFIPEVDV